MSWNTVYDRLEKSSCACGKGSVLRHSYMRMDDWNRTDDGYYGEEIQCDFCSKRYHIEHDIRHFFVHHGKAMVLVILHFWFPVV